MQALNSINHSNKESTTLEKTPPGDSSNTEKKFSEVLTASVAHSHAVNDDSIIAQPSEKSELENKIPSWVHPDYGYDPLNPRKPNMRELMDVMSSKDSEDFYAPSDEKLQKISRQASDLLYGVVGSSEDTRDWLAIMSSKEIIKKAREETGAMYEPEVDIQSNFNDDGVLIEQIAVIKDKKGNTLRSLAGDIAYAEETLINFGATKQSIPTNLEERVIPEKFDNSLNILEFLQNFDNKLTSVQQLVVQSASKVMANKISQEIPLNELAKL